MLVSFCVIAYNEEKAIKSLFSDIKAQDYPHEKIEVILVNAMSTDKTRELMEKFAEENKDFKRVCVLDNQKKIQAAGWNVAIKASAGDIIMRIDAHTMIPSDFVSKNVECIIGGEDISGGPRPNIAEDDTPWRHTLLLAESSMFGSSIAPYRKSHRKTYVKSIFHGAYRREVFDKAGMFDERLGRTEDNEMHYRIRKAGYRICYNPEIVSYQNIRNSWGEMLKQKYGNGYWIGLTLGICFRCFSFYHFVPLVFVLALIVTGVLAALGFTFPIVTLGTVYILINLLMSILAIKGQKKYWQYFLLPVIFSSLHIAYGVGTLVGIIKMPFWRKRGKRMMIKLHLLKNKLFSTVYMECGMLGIGIVIWMLAYFCSDFNLAIAGITVAFLANLTYSIRHFREQFVFFFMQISIFTFLISRPMIGWLSGMAWWNNASQAAENVWFALSLLIVTETALFLGNILTVYLVKRKSNHISNRYSEGMIVELRFISQVVFYITMLFYLVEQIEPLFVIGIGNYLSYYTDFTSQLPGIMHTVASFMKYSLCIFLATLPSKRSAMFPLILYVLSTIPSLLIGVRNPFILSLIFCLVYFLLRDYLCDAKRWVGKLEKILIFIGTPILLIFFTLYASFRSGLDVKVGNVFRSILDFFYGQGVSFDVLCIGYGYMPGLKILCPCNYTFGGIIDYLYRGTIGQKIFNTQPLTTYNSVFNAENSNSLSHALSYLSLKDDYLAGRGRGSSYLLEVTTDFGWIGVIVFSLLLGSLLILMVYFFGKKILLSTLILACLQNMFFMPRAEATSWLTFIVTLQFWCCVAGCYLVAFIFNKWKIIPRVKKMLE